MANKLNKTKTNIESTHARMSANESVMIHLMNSNQCLDAAVELTDSDSDTFGILLELEVALAKIKSLTLACNAINNPRLKAAYPTLSKLIQP